jgi:nucleolar protein 6
VEQDQGQAGRKPAKSSKAKTKSTGKQKTDDEKVSKTAARFIVFVGNLPYDATKEQVERHFEKLGTVSVRLSTDKATGRSKGFAFVEFDGYDKMKTCLKLYHHSMFNPQAKDAIDRSNAGSTKVTQEGRRINVELTAGGGGGKSEGRRAKIEAKNKKLDEQRSRRSEKERAEQQEAGQKKKQEQPLSEANATGTESKSGRNHGSIHPSRLARMKR